jgi:F-type H+-transporting ATPase subunit beta
MERASPRSCPLAPLALLQVGGIHEVVDKADKLAKEVAARKDETKKVGRGRDTRPDVGPGKGQGATYARRSWAAGLDAARVSARRAWLCGSPFGSQAKSAEALKDVPSLDKLLGEIKEEVIEADDGLEEDFKAEAISSENMVRGKQAGARLAGSVIPACQWARSAVCRAPALPCCVPRRRS